MLAYDVSCPKSYVKALYLYSPIGDVFLQNLAINASLICLISNLSNHCNKHSKTRMSSITLSGEEGINLDLSFFIIALRRNLRDVIFFYITTF